MPHIKYVDDALDDGDSAAEPPLPVTREDVYDEVIELRIEVDALHAKIDLILLKLGIAEWSEEGEA